MGCAASAPQPVAKPWVAEPATQVAAAQVAAPGTQIAVAAYLFAIGLQTYALVLGLLIAPQIWAQTQYLLKDPVKYDVKYQGTAQPFLVFGILTTALAVSQHPAALA